MQVYQGKILNITLENEEIEILRTILNQLTGKKIGFVKTLDLEQLDLLERLKEAINHPDNNK